MRPAVLCLDANLVVQYVLDTASSALKRQWSAWVQSDEVFVAPVLLRYEVTNALHRHARATGLSLEDVCMLLDAATDIQIELQAVGQDHRRALELAVQLNQPATYDAHYLALAERLGVEFWTADERLYNATRHALPWVRLVS